MQIISWLWIWELCWLQLAGSDAPYGYELGQPTSGGAFQHSWGNCFSPLNIWMQAHTELGRDVDVQKVLPSAHFKWVCESIFMAPILIICNTAPCCLNKCTARTFPAHMKGWTYLSLLIDLMSLFPDMVTSALSFLSCALCLRHTNAYTHTHTHSSF